MAIRKLDVENFRCLSQASLELDDRYNLILGSNGAGKTSVLEAIYLLGSGHSFRTLPNNLLIKSGASSLMSVGKVSHRHGDLSTLGIRVTREASEYRLNGERAKSVGELAREFPVQVIDPDIHDLVEGSPAERRRFIDWGVFHVEHQFHEVWRRFNRALKQRNASLRNGIVNSAIWDAEICSQGSLVTAWRESYLRSLRPFVNQLGTQLLSREVDFEFQPGWRRSISLIDALEENKQRDLARSTTSVGPHRAELLVTVDGNPAKERVSRGQQKLLACALTLAQQLHRVSIGAPATSLLLDDPAAELDVDNLGKLLEAISDLPVQLVVTALSDVGLDFMKNAKVFHVEHGTVKAMA